MFQDGEALFHSSGCIPQARVEPSGRPQVSPARRSRAASPHSASKKVRRDRTGETKGSYPLVGATRLLSDSVGPGSEVGGGPAHHHRPGALQAIAAIRKNVAERNGSRCVAEPTSSGTRACNPTNEEWKCRTRSFELVAGSFVGFQRIMGRCPRGWLPFGVELDRQGSLFDCNMKRACPGGSRLPRSSAPLGDPPPSTTPPRVRGKDFGNPPIAPPSVSERALKAPSERGRPYDNLGALAETPGAQRTMMPSQPPPSGELRPIAPAPLFAGSPESR